VRKNLGPDDLRDLLEQPLVAVLATYRRDGTVLLSLSGTSGRTEASTS
jgi:hypothetical protein